jgi:hypothetical protein
MGRWIDCTMIGTVVLAFVVGALERLWLLAHTPLLSDVAVVGLMARQIEHGHMSTFYWGQPFGGVEPYVVAAVNWVVPGPLGVNVTSVLLSALAAVLVGLIVTELCGRWRAGLVAAALAWVWPYATVWNSTRELGFHFASLVLGLLMVFTAIRVAHGHTGGWNLLVLGASAGMGFWSSPEIVYFVLPAAIVLLGSLRRWIGLRAVAVVAFGLVAGAFPWIYTNLGSGFASLSLSGGPQFGISTNYWSRFSIAFNHYIPIALGLKLLYHVELIKGPIGVAVESVLLVAMLALFLATVWLFLRTGRALGVVACGVGIIAFPFLLAANDKTWFWYDGRYSVDLSFLVAIFAAAGVSVVLQGPRLTGTEGAQARGHRASLLPAWLVPVFACAVLLVGTLFTLGQSGAAASVDQRVSARTGVDALFAGWNDPNTPLQDSVRAMDSAHILDAYADYWTAYVIDYLDPGVTVTPSPLLDVNRSQSLLDAVRRSPRPAWLFLSPSHLGEAEPVLGAQQGPGPYTESSFLAMLATRGIHARVVQLGILDAVIPDHKVALR